MAVKKKPRKTNESSPKTTGNDSNKSQDEGGSNTSGERPNNMDGTTSTPTNDQAPQTDGQGGVAGVEEESVEVNPLWDEDGDFHPALYGSLRPQKFTEAYNESLYYSDSEYSRDENLEEYSKVWEEETGRSPASDKKEISFLDASAAGLRNSLNNFGRAVKDLTGADIPELHVPKGEIRQTTMFNLLGGQLGHMTRLGGVIAAAAVGWPALAGGFALGFGVDALNAWIGAYSDPEDLESLYESEALKLLNLARGKEEFGLIPEHVAKMTPRQRSFRIFASDFVDTISLLGGFKAVKGVSKGVFKGAKRLVTGVPDPSKATRELPINTSSTSLDEAGNALARAEDELTEEAIERIRIAEETDYATAKKVYDRGMKALAKGNADAVINNTAFARALTRAARLAHDTDLHKSRKAHLQSVEESIETLKKVEPPPIPGKTPPPIPGKKPPRIKGDNIVTASREAGLALDNLGKGKVTTDSIQDAIQKVHKAIIKEPNTVKTKDLPRDKFAKELEGKPAQDSLANLDPESGTGGDIMSIMAQKKKVINAMVDQFDNQSDEILESLGELDDALTLWGSRKATKAGGNLQVYDNFAQLDPVIRKYYEGIKIERQKFKMGINPQGKVKAQKMLKTFNESMDAMIKNPEGHHRVATHMKRMVFNYWLSNGALLKAVKGNVISPILENMSQAGLHRPDRVLALNAKHFGQALKNAFNILKTKEGRQEIKKIYIGEARGHSRYNLEAISEEQRGTLDKAFTVFTNMWSGSLSSLDFLMRDALEETAARSVWRDTILTRLRNGESPEQVTKAVRHMLRGDKIEYGNMLDFNRHLNELTDGLLTRGGVKLDHVNARGETHSPLTFTAALIHKVLHAPDAIFKKVDTPFLSPVFKGIVKPLRFVTETTQGFVDVGTSLLNYTNDFIPMIGTRMRATEFSPLGTLSYARRIVNPFELTRKQVTGLTLVGSVKAMNMLQHEAAQGDLIKFEVEPWESRKKFRKFKGRTGFRVGDQFYDKDLAGNVGDIFNLMYRAKDIMTFPHVGSNELFAKEMGEKFLQAVDLVVGDTPLSLEYGNILSDILQLKAKSALRRGKDLIYPIAVPWAPVEEKMQRYINDGLRQAEYEDPITYYRDLLGPALKELREFENDLPETPLADMFGTVYSKGENWIDNQKFYGKWGRLIRAVHPVRGPTPKANVIRDFLVLTGTISNDAEFEINGKIYPKKVLPKYMQFAINPPTRQGKVADIFTQGVPYATDLTPKLYNRRQLMVGMDLKYIHKMIDSYTRFYKSYPTANEGLKDQCNQAVTALAAMKEFVFNPKYLRKQLSTYKKDYRTVDMLYDVLEGNTLATQRTNDQITKAMRSSLRERQLGIDLSTEERDELASRMARIQAMKIYYDMIKTNADTLIGFEPELFLEFREFIEERQDDN